MKGLLDAGLCVKTTDGYQVVNWVELGQSTAAAVEQNRAGSRARAQKQRDLAAEKLAKLTRAKSPAEELGVRRQGRQAGDRKNLHAVGPEAVTEPSPSEETADMRAWDTAVPGSGGLKRVPGSVYDLCTVCGGRLLAPSSMSLGVCDKRDAAHSGTRSVAG